MSRTPQNIALGIIALGIIVALGLSTDDVNAQYLVPGTGTPIDYVGDKFEDESWEFINRYPKSSRENDSYARGPLGYSTNRRWSEGPERGHPDHLKVIPTPAGGIEGSKFALLMQTLHSGIPGHPSRDVQQDDLIVNVSSRIGSSIRVSEMPSCVFRLYLPPPEQWENRSGPHFGFRAGVSTTTNKSSGGIFGRSGPTTEPYWPGMWVHFRSETSKGVEKDSALIKVRGDQYGRDFRVLEISQWGWWTLGMSFTPDGRVHYFASPGVDPLTAEDHLTSQYPYGFKAQYFRSFFFNACNYNNGASWSTPFVLDDAQLFVLKSDRIMTYVNRKIEREKKLEEQRTAKKEATAETTKR